MRKLLYGVILSVMTVAGCASEPVEPSSVNIFENSAPTQNATNAEAKLELWVDAGGVDVHVQNADVQAVLTELAAKTNRKIVVAPDVSGTMTADLCGVDFYDALDVIVDGNGFRCREIYDAIYVYTRGRPLRTTAESEQPRQHISVGPDGVTMHVKEMDIHDALVELGKQSKRAFNLPDEMEGTITADFSSVDFYDAMDAILTANGFGFREVGGIIHVKTAIDLNPIYHGCDSADLEIAGDDDGIEMHVKDADIRKVLGELAKLTRHKMIIHAGVDAKITADLYGVSLYDALDAILNANGFSYRETNEVIHVYTQG